ncbi:MAG: serine protease [Victivallales bacterium]|nr:serine protease [Victivallales bacterium]
MKIILFSLTLLPLLAYAQPPQLPPVTERVPAPDPASAPAPVVSKVKIINEVSLEEKINSINKYKTSIIKIFAMRSNPNYNQPWQNYPQRSASGSGFVISGNRILTNAHIVANQTFMMVRKPGLQKKYIAELEVVGHECDMAILKVNDPEFFSGLKALELGDLPELQSSVTVMGYPVGGDNISVTEGVISRIEPIIYSHSGRKLLAVQIDAAINPGNSGGPVIHKDKVVGIAFQGLSQSQNIGYMIPVPVIKHFLKDVEDKVFDGFPHVPFLPRQMENPDLRSWSKMTDAQTGVIISSLPPEVKTSGEFKIDDIVMAVDGVSVDNDATVKFRGDEVIYFGNIIWSKFIGENCRFDILRDGKKISVDYRLRRYQRLVPNRTFDELPTYYFIGGLLFVPLTINHLDEYRHWYDGPIDLVYQTVNGKVTDELKEIVVLSRVLAAEVNLGYQGHREQIVEKVNGKKIKDLNELISIVENCRKGFIVFQLQNETKLVFDSEKLKKSTAMIMRRYRIPRDRSLNLSLKAPQIPRYGPLK